MRRTIPWLANRRAQAQVATQHTAKKTLLEMAYRAWIYPSIFILIGSFVDNVVFKEQSLYKSYGTIHFINALGEEQTQFIYLRTEESEATK